MKIKIHVSVRIVRRLNVNGITLYDYLRYSGTRKEVNKFIDQFKQTEGYDGYLIDGVELLSDINELLLTNVWIK